MLHVKAQHEKAAKKAQKEEKKEAIAKVYFNPNSNL